MKRSFLGIDTSNYMTSLCIIDEHRQVIYEGRELLQVKKGARGLQQSQAVFQHIKNLPKLFQKGEGLFGDIGAIAVSRSPRPLADSYMPVFMAGVSIAESLTATLNIPVFYTSHQEGHIAAGIYSEEKRPQQSQFLAIHLSGGTSEILSVKDEGIHYAVHPLGGTLDLHAGQLVDRIGVLLGFSFPAGRCVEELAKKSSEDFQRIPTSVKDFSFHFSGAETEAIRRVKKEEANEQTARAVEHVIAASLEKVIKKAVEAGYPKEVLIVGGVAQNQYIRDHLLKRLQHPRVGARLYFAKKEYSGDNAFGVANIGLNQFLSLQVF